MRTQVWFEGVSQLSLSILDRTRVMTRFPLLFVLAGLAEDPRKLSKYQRKRIKCLQQLAAKKPEGTFWS